EPSGGKIDRLRRRPAGSTSAALDGYGLRDQWPARPTAGASIRFLYVRPRLCATLPSDAVSRRRPCVLANPSPPSGWIGDFHPQAVDRARHTTKPLRGGVDQTGALAVVFLRLAAAILSSAAPAFASCRLSALSTVLTCASVEKTAQASQAMGDRILKEQERPRTLFLQVHGRSVLRPLLILIDDEAEGESNSFTTFPTLFSPAEQSGGLRGRPPNRWG